VLRQYIKVADTEVKEHGEVMTPLTLVEEMLDKLPTEVWSNPSLKWLDPFNGVGTFPSIVVKRLMDGLKNIIVDDCERYRHIIENMLYVCEIQPKNMFLFHTAFDREDDYELNTYYGSFLDKGFDEHMKNVWGVEKFDIVLGNPPYLNGTHHKFIVKGFELLNENGISLIVHPSTLLFSRKEVKKNKIEKKLLEIIYEYESTITFIDGYKYFDNADFFVPLSITINKKIINDDIVVNYNHLIINRSEIVKDLSGVFLHSSPIVKKIKDKVFNKIETSLEENLFRNGKNSPFYLTINTLAGGAPKNGKISKDFYCMIYKKDENNIEQYISQRGIPTSEKVHTNQIGLNTHQECVNTANTLMTKFMRFSLSLNKLSGYLTRGELKSVPFIDPSIEWTDDMLFRHFELTQEEINFINEFIGNWYQRDFQNIPE
jgi:site-specific DNA-methyltransferase (adenine-specific)